MKKKFTLFLSLLTCFCLSSCAVNTNDTPNNGDDIVDPGNNTTNPDNGNENTEQNPVDPVEPTDPVDPIITTYVVTFDSNGGSEVPSQTIEEGKTATQPDDPTRDGYDFRCWFLNNREFNFSTPITEDITLVAYWEQNDDYVEPEDPVDPVDPEPEDPNPVDPVDPVDPVNPEDPVDPDPVDPEPSTPSENEHDDENDLTNDGSVEKPYTCDEAYAIGMTLESGQQTPIKYFIKGYVAGGIDLSKIESYGNVNFNMKDNGGTHYFKCYQVYYLNNKKFTSNNTINVGDEVIVFTSILNYMGNTPETTDKGTAYIYAHNGTKSSSVPEQGFAEPSASAQVKTIAQLKSANSSWKTEGAKSTQLYRITGIAQWAVNSSYGNFDLVDDTGHIYIHGCTRSKQSLKQDGSYGYVINNDKSFSSIGMKPGDEVTIEGWYSYHAYTGSYGVPQFTGYVTNLVSNNASKITTQSYPTSAETYTGTYYSSIGSLSGTSLLTALHNLMDSTHTTYISYNSLYNGYTSAGEKTCFYSNSSVSKKNREHVWPQSLSGSSSDQLYGEDYGGSDFHHLRLAEGTNNSNRSNSMFGPVYGNKNSFSSLSYYGGGTNYYSSNVYEPADDIKGDIARIIMYMYMHYNCASNVNNPSGWVDRSYYGEMHVNWVMGPNTVGDCFKLLRLWNVIDPVSLEEKARNEQGYKMQGNRNPFIDHPSYADRIWG